MTPGIETTTGPLGQGIATRSAWRSPSACSTAEFGDELVDHHTYVIACDGCLMEGISHEAIALAGHLRLGRLIVLFDDNGISIDGPLSLSELGRPGEALRGRAAGTRCASTATIRRRSPRAIRRRADVRPADADRLQDDHRLRRAEQGRHRRRRTARRSAPRRSPARKAALGWNDAAVRDPGDDPRRLGARPARRGRRQRKAWTSGSRRCRADSAPSSSAA